MSGPPNEPVTQQYISGPPPAGPIYPPPPGHPIAEPLAPRNGLGIAALALAVIGLLGVATVVAPVVLGAAAIVVGLLGRERVKRGDADNGGVAVAAMVLGTLAIVVGLAFAAIWTTVWQDVRGGDYIDCVQKAGGDQQAQQRCNDQFRRTVQQRLSVTLTPATGS
jgi:hypothetical protein